MGQTFGDTLGKALMKVEQLNVIHECPTRNKLKLFLEGLETAGQIK